MKHLKWWQHESEYKVSKAPTPNPSASAKKNRDLFAERRTSLYRLGFRSYEEYLASPLWKGIKAKVSVSNKGGKCKVCKNNRAVEFHHKSYDLQVMQGLDLRKILPICRECHEFFSRTQAVLK